MTKQFLVISSDPAVDVSFLVEQGYLPIVRALPEKENDFKTLSICSCNFHGYVLILPNRMPTLEEMLYITARIRRIPLGN